MGNCWARAGDAAFDKQDWSASSSHYRRALANMPSDAALKGNLARVDINDAIEISKSGDCDKARTLARRAEKVDASLADKGTQILEACSAQRAKVLADKKDWAAAAAELRRGLRDAPKSEALHTNLGTMLHNLAAQLLKDKDCDGARALLPELGQLKKDEAKRAVEQSCH
jgi:tetratricopeptide (TPR) repeat protein